MKWHMTRGRSPGRRFSALGVDNELVVVDGVSAIVLFAVFLLEVVQKVVVRSFDSTFLQKME